MVSWNVLYSQTIWLFLHGVVWFVPLSPGGSCHLDPPKLRVDLVKGETDWMLLFEVLWSLSPPSAGSTPACPAQHCHWMLGPARPLLQDGWKAVLPLPLWTRLPLKSEGTQLETCMQCHRRFQRCKGFLVIYVSLIRGFYALIKKLQKLSLLLKNVFTVDCLSELNSVRSPGWLHARLLELIFRVGGRRSVRNTIKKKGCDNFSLLFDDHAIIFHDKSSHYICKFGVRI